MSDKTYETLLEQAKKDPESVDFAKLRKAFIESDAYMPLSDKDLKRDELFKAMEKKDPASLIPDVEELLEEDFMSISTQFVAGIIYDKAGDQEKSEYHMTMARKLIEPVLRSGDGKTLETAYVVLSVSEEFAVLGALGLRGKGQSLLPKDGHHYDCLTCESRSGEEVNMYFNIDISMNRMDQLLEGLGDEKVS
jgi:hypothetical protein